ncbi:hypothetical protein [Curtobacterium sp. MCBA15_016]|uniref:hypothetical protein n=1 Tax=Curtobacterium sp. MCBA15_016 TaxID=1898740 RepID=UPI001113CB91|nr:hypothetical protein [Curtobacterium sp. MCBA15_016]
MKHSTNGRIVSIGAACAVVAASVIGAAPANAVVLAPAASDEVPPRTPSAVLSAIRAELAASGSFSDVASFDRLSADQRHELASYFLDPAAASAATAESAENVLGPTTVRTSGDFEWGAAQEPSEAVSDEGSIEARASRSSWGTQWFAFAGIRLTETKVSMSYEYSGTTAKKMLGYSCTVVRNVQPFTEVRTSKSSGYVSGGQATAKCKVTVKRGVLTPWGTIAWSTYSAVQRLSAKGNGAITANRWE